MKKRAALLLLGVLMALSLCACGGSSAPEVEALDGVWYSAGSYMSLGTDRSKAYLFKDSEVLLDGESVGVYVDHGDGSMDVTMSGHGAVPMHLESVLDGVSVLVSQDQKTLYFCRDIHAIEDALSLYE